MKRILRLRRGVIRAGILSLACLLVATSCRPQIIYRQRTREEVEALGNRAEIEPRDVLLSVDRAYAPAETEKLLASVEGELKRLSGLKPTGVEMRRWQVIYRHNKAVLLFKQGQAAEADKWFDAADKLAQRVDLQELRWQVLYSKAMAKGGDRAILAEACKILETEPGARAEQVDANKNARIVRAYGLRLKPMMKQQPAEETLGLAEKCMAVQLTRTFLPSLKQIGVPGFEPLVKDYQAKLAVYESAREQLAKQPTPDEDSTVLSSYQRLHDQLMADKKLILKSIQEMQEQENAQWQDEGGIASLFRPIPGDLMGFQVHLAPDLGAAVFFPVPGGVASWWFSMDGVAAHLVDAKVADWTAALGSEPDSAAYKAMIDEASTALLAPLEKDIPAETKRLYVICSGRLWDLPWASLKFRGKPLAESVQISLAGGLGDVNAAFVRKTFTHSDILVSYIGETAPGFVGELPKSTHLYKLDLAQSTREQFVTRSRFFDIVLATDELVPDERLPLLSYLRFPGDLSRIQSVDFAQLAAQSYKSYALCLDGWKMRASGGSYDTLRPILRAVIAAGFPSVVVSDGMASPDGETRFWKDFLEDVRKESVGAAVRKAQLAVKTSGVQPADWVSYRLYGHIGLNPDEFRSYSQDAFTRTLKAANKLYEQTNWEMAIRYFNELQTLGAAIKADHVFLAEVHRMVGLCWEHLRDYDNAARSQQLLLQRLEEANIQAFAEREGVKDWGKADEKTRKRVEEKRLKRLAFEFQNLGTYLTKADKFDEALKAYQKAYDIYKAHGFATELQEVTSQKARSYDKAGKYEDALKLLSLLKQSYSGAKQYLGEAQQLMEMGNINLKRLNNYFRAEQLYRQAVEKYRQANDKVGMANATIAVALARRALGDLEGALKILNEVQKAAADLNEPALQAKVNTELGNTYWFRGQYQDAFQWVLQSNRIAEKLGKPFQLNVNYQLEGLIYWELNQYERAHESLDEAMKYAREAEDRLEIATAWNNKGLIYRRQGKLTQALDCFNQALTIDTKLATRWGEAYDYRNLGVTFRLMGQLEKSAEHINRAITLSRAIGDDINRAKAYNDLGDTLLEMRRYDEAKNSFDDALKLGQERFIRDVVWRAQYGLGRLEIARGRKAEALEYLKQAIAVVEAVRGELKVDELKNGYLSNKMDLYDDIVTLLVDMGRPEEAFEYSERSRARNFIDIFANQAFELRDPEQRRLYNQQQAMLVKMREKEDEISDTVDAATLKKLNAELTQLKRDYSKLLLDIRLQHPELSSFVEVSVITLPDLYKLLDPEVALVVYYTTKERTFVWLIYNGTVKLTTVAMGRDQLAQTIGTFREKIQLRDDLQDVRRMSKGIYDRVLQPIVQQLDARVKNVGIVPHGPFHYLSFASLWGYRNDRYLIEKYALFYSPSASVLQQTLKGAPAEKKRELNVLAVGNPDVGTPAYDLPFAEKEVESIKRDFVKVTELTGEHATETWVKANLGRFQIIHFASHGEFDAVAPLLSALKLTPDAKSDGNLRVEELTGIKLNAVLVTLSACQSGLGELKTGDELVSLARAFVYAGTRSILSTLWRVDDVSTAILIKHFYRNYVELPAAESLRLAQLRVLNDGQHAHPMYWAGVTLTGDYR